MKKRVTSSHLVGHEVVFLHIWGDKKSGWDLYKYLLGAGEKYDKRRGKTL